ncbi:SusE outer membrane protein [Lutibacter oricola]|uniref:SusE outer membrane protein n=1 Tax=Lutibacter oricola TaxID=762486 RepID=A0A1H3GI29_9FLAO|nr:hypothetical protein [Lutibacter oricola]SDY02963.1 SusE outer membrane protein [Lutibacter oricola]
MRKFLYLAVIAVGFWSCGGSSGGGDTPPTPEPEENNAPSSPSLTQPANNLLCIDNNLTFQWGAATDPDGDAVKYLLEISTNNQFSSIEHSFSNLTGTSKSVTLDKGVAYYWRVKATDTENASSGYSSTYQFYTEGVGIVNHLPFSPELISPVLNSVVTTAATTSLEWNASDADTADTLAYDVYFGTDNPPATVVSADQAEKTYTATIAGTTTYYWKVVVKDDKGGATIGQVWKFTTD